LSFLDIPKLIVTVLCIVLICFMFPSHNDIGYKFNEGNTWSYENLIASRDFNTVIKCKGLGNTDSIAYKNFEKGDLLISKNELIKLENYQVLSQYFENEPDEMINLGNKLIYFIGYFLLTALIILALLLFSDKYFPHLTKSIKGILFLLIWPLFFGLLVFIVNFNSSISPYIIPFCIVPIIVYNFYGGRLALFIHIVVVLIASFLSGLGYEFTFLQILAGIITVLVSSETRYWNKFFKSILLILGTYLIGYLGLALINSGSLNLTELPVFGWLIANAFLLLLAYPFISIIEKIFGITSSITLAELGDMNMPLLKELSIKAPGTMQHSLQVANLGEAAADKIGANSLLVKTAALYHDIGKIKKPEYFIENSKGENYHAQLNDNFESARIIIDHVKDGEIMAKKAKLPQIIIDMILTHHGTTRVEYFYRNQVNNNPEREFDESIFRYAGPKPKTKEQTILFLSDSVEAACKSLKQPTGQDIDNLVDKIFQHKISNNQLAESELTFQELETCEETFKSLLRSIHHVRIEYPEEKQA